MLKHVGRLRTNKRRVVVAYRTIPNDPYSCLCIMSDSLSSADHDDVMKLVESDAGQSSDEFYQAMDRVYLSDGRPMLAGLHKQGHLRKMPTADIEMTPNHKSAVPLNELNQIIADQKGVALEDLAVKPNKPQAQASAQTPATETVAEPIAAPLAASANEVLTDEQIAAKMRSDADRLFKEAKALREQAEELSPTKRKTTRKQTESAT
jgi:uncharacterized protein with von Willebrand factor type A (vWA) domain